MMNSNRKLSGYTMLELLLAVAVLGIITSFSFLAYIGYQSQVEIEVAKSIIASAVRRAQQLAMSLTNDSDWGIRINTGELVIFSGNTYAARDTDFDELIVIAPGLSITGATEIVFPLYAGELPTTVTLTINSAYGTEQVQINEKGTITY